MILFANNSTGSALTLIYLLMGDLTVPYKFFFQPLKTIYSKTTRPPINMILELTKTETPYDPTTTPIKNRTLP
jgi:hypothetical protein